MNARRAVRGALDLRQNPHLAHAHEARLDLIIDEGAGLDWVCQLVDEDWLNLCRFRLCLGRPCVADHQVNHQLLSLLCFFGHGRSALCIENALRVRAANTIQTRMVQRRVGDNSREQGGFRKREVQCVLMEISLGRSLDTYIAVGVGDLVEIQLEDVLLRVVLVEFNRIDDLPQFPVERALCRFATRLFIADVGADVNVLDQLLSDR